MSGMLWSGERSLDRPTLMSRAARVATGLQSLGLAAGDNIALFLRNDFPLFEASFGAAMLGVRPVPVNWHFTADEAGYLFDDSKAKLIVVHADLLPGIRSALPPDVPVLIATTPPEIAESYRLPAGKCAVPAGMTDWDEWRDRHTPLSSAQVTLPSSIIYTSGTTGRPKGVCFAAPTPEQAETRTRMLRHGFGFSDPAVAPENIVAVVTGPMYHSALNGYGLGALRIGATAILQSRFDPGGLLRLIEERRVTHIHMVPIMFNRLLALPRAVRERYDLSSLRYVAHSAAPCAPDVKIAMIKWWGPVINEYYGSTESGMVVSCTTAEWQSHPGTVGRAFPESIVRVVDDNGKEIGPGEIGEILCRSRGIADFTYYGDDKKRREVEKNGLITVGDVGYLDKDGFLYICDRKRDMVISGGVNIYPAEIESHLHLMPGVRDCAVFGIPDDEFGESVCAVIEPQEGRILLEADVVAFLRDRLAKYKLPKRIDFRDQLPREDTGKIFKRKIRDEYWNKAGRSI